ncbi:group II truncated hemoglobin [Sphingobium fuliginis]|uniref:group II truncated hemoglobin n=1 Tax=Sphingobium fuliginis (strain ATCC 27551) TaxID=336203 RepID=UPI0037CA609F
MTAAEQKQQAPYDLVGGAVVVRNIVDRFYDLMDQEDAYRELRALHAPELGPMRVSLAGFLNAWLGGPRDWFDDHPVVCMMSAHARLPITGETADQWCDAMRRAIADSTVDPALGVKMAEALSNMAQGMAARAASAA